VSAPHFWFLKRRDLRIVLLLGAVLSRRSGLLPPWGLLIAHLIFLFDALTLIGARVAPNLTVYKGFLAIR
jgi:hypothetical protein